MKKTKMILACLAIAVALGGLTGCMFPDYQLDMDVYATDQTPGTVGNDSARVGYTLRNVGSRDLTNVQITAELWRIDPSGPTASIREVNLGPFTIDVGDTVTGSSALEYWTNDGEVSEFEAYIISVGWDANE